MRKLVWLGVLMAATVFAENYEVKTIIDGSKGQSTVIGSGITNWGGVVWSNSAVQANSPVQTNGDGGYTFTFSAKDFSLTRRAITNAVLIPAASFGFDASFCLHPWHYITDDGGYSNLESGWVVFTLQKSYDSMNWSNILAWPIPANGTNTVYQYTNFTINDFGYVRVGSITTTNLDPVTNLVMRIYTK